MHVEHYPHTEGSNQAIYQFQIDNNNKDDKQSGAVQFTAEVSPGLRSGLCAQMDSTRKVFRIVVLVANPVLESSPCRQTTVFRISLSPHVAAPSFKAVDDESVLYRYGCDQRVLLQREDRPGRNKRGLQGRSAQSSGTGQNQQEIPRSKDHLPKARSL